MLTARFIVNLQNTVKNQAGNISALEHPDDSLQFNAAAQRDIISPFGTLITDPEPEENEQGNTEFVERENGHSGDSIATM